MHYFPTHGVTRVPTLNRALYIPNTFGFWTPKNVQPWAGYVQDKHSCRWFTSSLWMALDISILRLQCIFWSSRIRDANSLFVLINDAHSEQQLDLIAKRTAGVMAQTFRSTSRESTKPGNRKYNKSEMVWFTFQLFSGFEKQDPQLGNLTSLVVYIIHIGDCVGF